MPEIAGEVGSLYYALTGDGPPTTVFVPGLAQSVADTRAFGSAVDGTRVFVDLRGHGDSAPPASDDGWSYEGLADDVRRTADAVAATRAVGVSLGAGALVRLLADTPDRFERVVLALPGLLTMPRSGAELGATDGLADALLAGPGGDPAAIAAALARLQPASVQTRTDLKLWTRRRASEIGGHAGIAGAVRHMPRAVALRPPASLDDLAEVSAEVLVLAQANDTVHPVRSAEQLASALPRARLVISDVPWIWGGRSALRREVSEFLNR